MQCLVNVLTYDFSISCPSRCYIDYYKEYNITCRIVTCDLGIFRDKYLLELDGSQDNIEGFLDFLKQQRFKIITRRDYQYGS